MNWLDRHLNWVAVISTFGGLILNCFMATFALGCNVFPHPRYLASDFKIYLSIVIILITLFSIIWMIWVIKKKQIHAILLMFFIPSSLFSVMLLPMLFPGILFSGYFYNQSNFLGFLFFIFLFTTGLWFLGLTVLLLIKKKPPRVLQPSTKPLKGGDIESTELKRYCKSRKMLHIGLIKVSGSVLLVALVVAGFSFVKINTGYQVFIKKNDSSLFANDLNYSQFSFECPKSYYSPSGGEPIVLPGYDIILAREQIRPFRIESTSIIINISSSVTVEGNPIYPTLIEQCIYFYFQSYYGILNRNTAEIKNLTTTKIIVDGITSDYATFSVIYSNTKYRSKVMLLCFEREGTIWTIYSENMQDKTIEPSTDFNHLVKTIKIFD
jgi:hypothetical protein